MSIFRLISLSPSNEYTQKQSSHSINISPLHPTDLITTNPLIHNINTSFHILTRYFISRLLLT